ncbi:MAG: tRNA (5-methylaminomethyl-2-thiouridine)(34)-methyltransferase MnmD [Candidatus Omnitrophica bacterium]|nr:tRNA (5-methylaminomethyl-2-thiouridine)(34)-methyltransferase MnmD [Candidatus Omnitrophota bacterium]
MIEFADIDWDNNGLPHSRSFNDKYFCQENGLAESYHVFCGGNELSLRWQALAENSTGTFTITETGFGSGLNFLCAWQLFQDTAPSGWTLRYISIDRFPLRREDLSRALNLWPELKTFSDQLLSHYHPTDSKIETSVFSDKRIHLTLLFDEVSTALADISKDTRVDAWFLDGFAPACNPFMWSADVFHNMARLSHKETTVSTFTVAGIVKQGLRNAGFKVQKAPGFGRKRHMLKGIFQND